MTDLEVILQASCFRTVSKFLTEADYTLRAESRLKHINSVARNYILLMLEMLFQTYLK